LTLPDQDNRPLLRSGINVQPIEYAREPYLLVRDHLELTPRQLLIPRALAPALAMCDGAHEREQIQRKLWTSYGISITEQQIDQLLQNLDEACLLENVRFYQAWDQALAAYREAPFRPLTCAPHVYPQEANALEALLEGFLDTISDQPGDLQNTGQVRGLVSPHIDYSRGGPVYAQVWAAAASAAREAEIAIVFGTDHYGGFDRFTLTRQHYATPYGVLPTDLEAVGLLAECLQPERAFAGEIRHRVEHSIELAVVWLHHIRGGEPLPLLPILCGAFDGFTHGAARPEDDASLQHFIQAIRELAASRKALVVAAGDLAHVGPAFGGPPLDTPGRAALRQADDRLIAHMSTGKAGAFLAEIHQSSDRNNVCGTAPIYLTMQTLAPTSGRLCAYDHCPADNQNQSTVSICGLLFE
jgi:AmmeMemoRadiSam system protein B